jgi:glycerophosphoryl diester phosphodiesterase
MDEKKFKCFLGLKIFNIATFSIAGLYLTWYSTDSRRRHAAIQYTPEDVHSPLPNILEKHHVQVVVHRGATYAAPENTFAAAVECIRLGVDYVEVDIHKSFNGVHYIMHDLTLDRTTNGTGPVHLRHSSYINERR